MEPTDLPLLETLHVGHALEQIARGYLTGANCNRWRQHVFSNQEQPTQSNLLTYFYRFEFQSRGTLHLHMLVWVKDLSLIRPNLLHASIPWENANDAFLIALSYEDRSLPLPVCLSAGVQILFWSILTAVPIFSFTIRQKTPLEISGPMSPLCWERCAVAQMFSWQMGRASCSNTYRLT